MGNIKINPNDIITFEFATGEIIKGNVILYDKVKELYRITSNRGNRIMNYAVYMKDIKSINNVEFVYEPPIKKSLKNGIILNKK